jgi:ABC-type Fe3+/spermidine/putrescine transport system ATPase subunit
MNQKIDLELISLTKRYGTTVAVDAISYHFSAGTYACLLGPSGCGKSSTLRMIARHESVSDGAITLGGRDISDLPPAKRGTAMMFQATFTDPAALNLADPVEDMLAFGQNRIDSLTVGVIEKCRYAGHVVAHSAWGKRGDRSSLF